MSKNFWAHKTVEIQEGTDIGEGTKIWHHCQVLKGARIGRNCSIGHNCFVGSRAQIGNNVKVASNVDVWDLVTLEDYVFAGPSVVFTNVINPRSKYPRPKDKWTPTLVKEGASIGANATIICGHVIGRNAFIGAGAVVNIDIPDYAVAVGVPAKIIGWVCECGQKLNFENNEAVCEVCKRKYEKSGDKVNLIR